MKYQFANGRVWSWCETCTPVAGQPNGDGTKEGA